jgi:hypothetical protein
MFTKAPTTQLQDTIDGRSLSYRLRRANPRQRTTRAKGLVTGEKRIGQLTRRQASTICKVSSPLVAQR